MDMSSVQSFANIWIEYIFIWPYIPKRILTLRWEYFTQQVTRVYLQTDQLCDNKTEHNGSASSVDFPFFAHWYPSKAD